jgi:hypothetical protein
MLSLQQAIYNFKDSCRFCCRKKETSGIKENTDKEFNECDDQVSAFVTASNTYL